jgi:hypothetical protein
MMGFCFCCFMELSTQACNDRSPASPNTQYLKKKVHLDFIWTLGCKRLKVLSKARVRSAELDMHEYTCGGKVHDLIVVDANWLWTWATQQSFTTTTLWYYCYNNCTCIMTTHYCSNLCFSFPHKNYWCPKFDSQEFNSLLKS